MKFEYIITNGTSKDNIDLEVEILLSSFYATLEKEKISKEQVVKLSIFYNPHTCSNLLHDIEENIINIFEGNCPALSFIAQPPLNGGNISIETCFVNEAEAEIIFKKHSSISYTLVKYKEEEHLFVSGIQSFNDKLSILEKSEYSFSKLEEILLSEDFTFSNIIRQWNYIEGIIDSKNNSQNYQVFNDIRTKYYNKNNLTSNYPAATGIGIQEGGIIIDIHALKATKGIELFDIANPLQIDAFNYSEEVLEGKPTGKIATKTTPKFSRAKGLLNSKFSHVLVSGTASIQGEKTIGLNDVQKQTEFTINNIEQLIQHKSLRLDKNESFNKFSMVRVYIKNSSDYKPVKSVCDKYFSTSNIIYIIADVCRDNLLVEIEGVVSFSIVR